MNNPYFELHKEFKSAGAELLMSSGQACVLLGIATFSKDGDWVIKETKDSCSIVLEILERKNASYQLGIPLDPDWLSQGWTSHFEYFLDNGYRMRIDFCSRPPRVPDISALWRNAGKKFDVDVVDLQSLIELKQTRRIRDYSIIGALAEVAGFNLNKPELSLRYLQDYDLLKKSVDLWPEIAQNCDREAVQTIVQGRPRKDTIISLAIEQDEKIQADVKRIDSYREKSKSYQRKFTSISAAWKNENTLLSEQHNQLLLLAKKELK
jgi:hypothetical protein